MYSGGVGSGSYLQYTNAVSGDGVHVVGYGYNRSRNRCEAYCTHLAGLSALTLLLRRWHRRRGECDGCVGHPSGTGALGAARR